MSSKMLLLFHKIHLDQYNSLYQFQLRRNKVGFHGFGVALHCCRLLCTGIVVQCYQELPEEEASNITQEISSIGIGFKVTFYKHIKKIIIFMNSYGRIKILTLVHKFVSTSTVCVPLAVPESKVISQHIGPSVFQILIFLV